MEKRNDLVAALLIDATLDARIDNPDRAARVLCALGIGCETATRVLKTTDRRRPVKLGEARDQDWTQQASPME